MFEQSNLFLFLFSVLPALLYSALIYLKIPAGNIKLRATIGYLMIGIISPMFVLAFNFIFPKWGMYIDYDYSKLYIDPIRNSFYFLPSIFALFFNAYIQIALIEELCKWTSGSFINLVRGSWVKRDSPIAVMFYYCMIATGFAITENVVYAQRAMYTNSFSSSLNPTDIIFLRSTSAIILHMICGLFMGYFIALGRQFGGLKKISYTLLGVLVATFIHGAYDFNLSKSGSENDYLYFGNLNIGLHIANSEMIIISLLLSFFMGNHLLKIKYREIPKLRSNN